MNDHSYLVSKTLNGIYPFVMLFGIYIILNGHMTPGGGFQGGAIIASLFIIKYLVMPSSETDLKGIRLAEKIILLLILLFPIGFLLTYLNVKLPMFNTLYLILMNLLIGLKVACGMIIIFVRFIFYEAT